MRAVVTGSSGFIGNHLSERLVTESWDVVGLDCFTPLLHRDRPVVQTRPAEGERSVPPPAVESRGGQIFLESWMALT